MFWCRRPAGGLPGPALPHGDLALARALGHQPAHIRAAPHRLPHRSLVPPLRPALQLERRPDRQPRRGHLLQRGCVPLPITLNSSPVASGIWPLKDWPTDRRTFAATGAHLLFKWAAIYSYVSLSVNHRILCHRAIEYQYWLLYRLTTSIIVSLGVLKYLCIWSQWVIWRLQLPPLI